MKKVTFTIDINAPAKTVYDVMLGISDIQTYNSWTTAFNPTSTYEGTWEEGSKMYFVGTDENGKKGGMVSKIAQNIPHQFVSIRHIGILDGDTEITEGPQVESWAGGLENYSFEEKNGVTTVTSETDTTEGFESYFDETWPKALAILKDLAEKKN